MNLQIFILTGEEDRVILDRRYVIVAGKAPDINLQDIVDDAVGYAKEDEMNLEAKRLIQQDKAES